VARPTPPAQRSRIAPALRQIGELAEVRDQMVRVSEREAGSLAFFPRPFVQASLPYRQVRGHAFERRAGHLRLRIEAPEDIGLPYGRYPRLLLAWLTTEAVRTRSPQLELGASLSEFLRALGVTVAGGEHGPIRRLREQMKRLFCAGITATWDGGSSFDVEKLGIVRRAHLWRDPLAPDQPMGAGSFVHLSQDFFDVVCASSVPFDLRAVRALRSTMAVDIYLWASYRRFCLRGRSALVPWRHLQWQFGNQCTSSEFRRQFREAAAKVYALQPHLSFKVDRQQGALFLPLSLTDKAP